MADEAPHPSRFLSDTILAALRDAESIEGERTIRDCPVCANGSWGSGYTTLRLLGITATGNLFKPLKDLDNPGVEVFPIWCERCGFLRLHAVQALMRD